MDFNGGGSYAYPGIGVTGWGETVYNVSVGGTDYMDLYNSLEGGKPAEHLLEFHERHHLRLGVVLHSRDSLERLLRQLSGV